MNKRQKAILLDFTTVTIITCIMVVAMVNFKDWINRSEAIHAMEHLGRIVFKYRTEHGSLPPESYVESIKGSLEGYPRLGNLRYRALWIDPESTPDKILAYSEKKYNSWLLDNGFVVLRLDGRVEWMKTKEFEELLAKQQSQMEIEMLKK